MTTRAGDAAALGNPPFFGAARGGLRFEFVMDKTRADDPFVVLDDSGRFSRVLLGRLAVGDDATLMSLAVKLQRDAYPTGAGTGQVPWTNRALDEVWARERRDVRSIDSPHVLRTLPVPDTALDSPPLWYCRKTDQYFHPSSPQSGAALRVCRDDAQLRDAGLRAYGAGLQRYLHAGTEGGKTIYYKRSAPEDEQPKPEVEVRSATDLVADFSVFVRGERQPAAAFPCMACPHRGECYPSVARGTSIPAEQHLLPVSFYDFAFLPMPVAELVYDEYCDLIGGASWEQVRARASGPGQRGRAQLFPTLDTLYARPTQWLFRYDARGCFALEVLRLKLTAFLQACSGMTAVHTAAGRPHLGIQPGNLVVKVTFASDGTPARWLGQVQLVDLGCGRRYLPADPSARDVPMRLVPDGAGMYTSPLAAAGDDEVAAAMGVEVVRNDEVEAGREVVLRLRPPAGFSAAAFRADDIVRVTPSSPIGGRRDAWLWGWLVDVRRDGLTVHIELPAGHALSGLAAAQTFDARVTLVKNLGPACDLYGLGMLLFRTLLVHDEQSMVEVEAAVSRCIDRLVLDLPGKSDPARFCRDHLLRGLHDHEAVFRPASILWSRADRADALDGFPERLWQEILLFAFRLTTSIREFSFVDSHADTHPQSPGTLGRELLAEVRSFLARVHVELFARAERDREIGEVCGDLLAELREKLVAGAFDAARGEPTHGEATRGKKGEGKS